MLVKEFSDATALQEKDDVEYWDGKCDGGCIMGVRTCGYGKILMNDGFGKGISAVVRYGEDHAQVNNRR